LSENGTLVKYILVEKEIRQKQQERWINAEKKNDKKHEQNSILNRRFLFLDIG